MRMSNWNIVMVCLLIEMIAHAKSLKSKERLFFVLFFLSNKSGRLSQFEAGSYDKHNLLYSIDVGFVACCSSKILIIQLLTCIDAVYDLYGVPVLNSV